MLPAPPVFLQLTEDDHEDMRVLAEKADLCAASTQRQQASAPIFSATVEDQEEIEVAAVGSSRSRRGGQRGRSCQSPLATATTVSVPSSSNSTVLLGPPLTPCSGWLDRRRGCASLTSAMATRLTAAAVTVYGRETDNHWRCSHCPPRQVGVSERPAIRRPLLG